MHTRIINTLRENPQMNISTIARLLKVKEIEVSQAQHAYIKPFLKRDSTLWSDRQYGKSFKKLD